MTINRLGPCQRLWDVWNEAHDQMLEKPFAHFRDAVTVQFDELEQHLQAGKMDAAAREAVDIISVMLNCLRRLGYKPEGVAALVRPDRPGTFAILGPFEPLWDETTSFSDPRMENLVPRFRRQVDKQLAELEKHWQEEDTAAAGRKALDIVAVAFSCLRWLEYQPTQVAELLPSRAENRMRGQTQAILAKYH